MSNIQKASSSNTIYTIPNKPIPPPRSSSLPPPQKPIDTNKYNIPLKAKPKIVLPKGWTIFGYV